MSVKLKKGEDITINMPFTYTIGDEGPVSGKILETIEDCENEVILELHRGDFGDVFLTAEK